MIMTLIILLMTTITLFTCHIHKHFLNRSKKFHEANKLLISIVGAREDENFHEINFIVYCTVKREEKLKKCETHHKMRPFI